MKPFDQGQSSENKVEPQTQEENVMNDLRCKKSFPDFSCLDLIDLDIIGNVHQWEDQYLKGLERISVNAFHDWEQEIRSCILVKALGSMTTQVSAYTVGCLFLGAWGLYSSNHPSQRCFKEDIAQNPNKELSVDTLSDSIFAVAKFPQKIVAPQDDEEYLEWERSATYLCASTLRLITKTDTNYFAAFKHIEEQFECFYHEDIKIHLRIDAACVKAIRDLMQQRIILRNSVVPFLFAFLNLKGNDKGLCRMLYEQHLCYTGMHAYRLLLDCTDKLKIDPNVLMKELRHPSANRALDEIKRILEDYHFPTLDKTESAKKAQTWKYARVFDSKVFAALQTKNSTFLVAILAHLAKLLGIPAAENVLNIKHIAEIPNERNNFYARIASGIHDYVVSAREQ